MSDAIRIVPLKLPEALREAPVAPSLTYRGGPLLTAVSVSTAFWGAEWNQAPLTDLMKTVNDFFDYVVTSPLIDQLAEYSVTGSTIGYGSHAGATVIQTPAPNKSLADADIRQLLSDQIAAGSLATPSANSLYVVVTPPGVTVVQGGSRSCQSFCGYHDTFGSNLYYAVLPYPGCSGCNGGMSVADAITVTASHELCEAITDPVPGQGWYDDQNGEIGDICAWQTKKLGMFTVQLEWSNNAASCV